MLPRIILKGKFSTLLIHTQTHNVSHTLTHKISIAEI